MDTSPGCENNNLHANEDVVSNSLLVNRIQTPSHTRKLVPLTPDLQRILDTKVIDSPGSDGSVVTIDSNSPPQQNSRQDSYSRHCFKNNVDFESRYKNIIALKDNEILNLKERLKRGNAEKKLNFEENVSDFTEPLNIINKDIIIEKLRKTLSEKETEITKLKEAEQKYIADARIHGDNLKRISKVVEIKTLVSVEKLKSIEYEKFTIGNILDDCIQDKKLVTDKKDTLITQLNEKLSDCEEKLKQYMDENKTLYSQLSKKNDQLKYYVHLDSDLFNLNEKNEELEALIKEKDKEINHLNERLQINNSAEVMALKKELKAVEKELKETVEKNNRLDDEMSKIMGHQNHLQKIRYVSKLKTKYNEVLKDHQKVLLENYTLKNENRLLKQQNLMINKKTKN